MRKFLVQLAILSSFVLLTCFLLSQVTFSDEFIVHKTKDTAYKKIGWNLNLIKNHQERIKGSTIFLGSSLVQGALNDSLMQNNGMNVINMGVPHNGNEIGVYFINRLMELKPKEVVLLKGKTPFQGLHKMTPLLYTSTGLFRSGQGFTVDYISFVFKKAKLCLEYFFFQIFPDKKNSDKAYEAFLYRQYGVLYAHDTIPQQVYDEAISRRTGSKSDEYYNLYLNDYLYRSESGNPSFMNKLKVLKRKFVLNVWMQSDLLKNTKSQERFVDTAIQLCEQEGIKISKLYVPKLVDVNQYEGYTREFYKKVQSDSVGVYDMDTYQFLKSRNHWADFDHVDQSGADLFTKKLLEEFK
ncbi:hypothetical protein [Flagellimonas marina]|jgi:hypothetical protein|uniref:SGNH/GDSL hydrolase family protein n=1 Tax=Flagellimonas marina TaxID=1775168 RepID=A0ABV8PKC3_9FLAO